MTSSAVTGTAQCDVYAAIKPSHTDRLTPATATMIENHNNIFWCNCPNTRPPDFTTSVCKP